jgi:hypothetical protein
MQDQSLSQAMMFISVEMVKRFTRLWQHIGKMEAKLI